MSNTHSIEVPSILPATKAYNTNYELPANGKQAIRAIDVMAPGYLVVEDIEGKQAIYDLNGLTAGVPYRLILWIRKVVGNADGSNTAGTGGTGTDIALAKMQFLH